MAEINFPAGTSVKLKPGVAKDWPQYSGFGVVFGEPHHEVLGPKETREWYHVKWPDGRISCWAKEEIVAA